MGVPDNAISVVIPAFNRRRDIARAIGSARAQTLPPHEILVVDDASTDGTADSVAELREPRLRLLRHEKNQGAAAARNTAIAEAEGAWIAFLDSDDEWDPSKLARQFDSLAHAPGDTMAGVTGYLIHDYRTGERRSFHPAASDTGLDALAWGCRLSVGSTMLARREVFGEIGMFDPALRRLEDWEWLMRYLPRHRLDAMPDALTIVHKGGDPSHTQVAGAVARIRARHRADWYRRSWIAGRKFDSTLLVEEAAAYHYAHEPIGAAALSLRALAAYPFRGSEFFATLARRALRRRTG